MAKTCVNFSKKCGGCPLLALPYPRQTAEKQQRLQKLLGGFAPVAPLRTMAEPWHYRNKAIASFATQQGKLVCGLYAEGTHKVLPSADCLLQNEVLNRTLAAVQDAARACRYTAFDEDKRTGLLRHVVLRCSRKGQVLVTLVTPGPELPGSRNFCAALRKKAPWVVSVVQNINPTLSSAVLGNREKTLYGPGFVLDTLCGLQFAISSRSFYQVNPRQTEVLYRAALDAAKLTGKETVVDAYCGTGTIGMIASDKAAKVIGVELNADAVRDARNNAKANQIRNIQFYQNDAGKFLVEMAGQGAKVDVVLMDPPRSGSTEEFMNSVAQIGPERIVYVSCNPETLVRDLKYFKKKGYRVSKGVGVDMFPFTEHVETVCLLSRKAQ